MTTNTAKKIDPFAPVNEDQEEVSLVVQEAKALTIASDEDLTRGREFVLSIKDLRKRIQDHHAPMIEAAHRAHKIALAKQKELVDPLDQAERLVRGHCEQYLTEKKRREMEDLRRREEAARQARERQLADARAKTDALLAGAKEDADKLAALRLALESATEIEAAVMRSQIAVLETAAEDRANAAAAAQAQLELESAVPDVVPVVEAEKVDGVSEVKEYRVEVVDMRVLCAAIGRGDVPVAAVKEVSSRLKMYAKDGIYLPGCKVTETVAARFRS
jgi:hypothetical protein